MIATYIIIVLIISVAISIPATFLFYRWLNRKEKKNSRSFPKNFGWEKRIENTIKSK